MNPCSQIEPYLNGALPEEAANAYRQHLAVCDSCRSRAESWRALESKLRAWADTQPVQEVTSADAFLLMRRAETAARPKSFNLFRILLVAAPTAAATALFIALTLRTPGVIETPSSEPIQVHILATDGTKSVLTLASKDVLEAPENTPVHADIEADTVGLSAKGKLRILNAKNRRTRLRLESGTIACKVAARTEGEEFVVEAGELTVRVVGTRFSVTRDASGKTGVTVEEGIVAVTDKDGSTAMLHAGEGIARDLEKDDWHVKQASEADLQLTASLLSPAAPIPIPEATPPSVEEETTGESMNTAEAPTPEDRPVIQEVKTEDSDTEIPIRKAPPLRKWQDWILSGRAENAASAMRRYLRGAPNDATVWALLADCERKTGKPEAAIKSYDKVRAIGTPAQSARAAYMEASLLQSRGEHRRALELFNTYKQSAHASPELLRLAEVNIVRSLVALGRCEEAEAAAERTRGQGHTAISANVDKMLERCRSAE